MERSIISDVKPSNELDGARTRMKIGAAPVSWGIFELGTDVEAPPAASIFEDMRSCGYAGTESGPPGYLGDADEARHLLEAHDLTLAGVFIPYPFTQGRLSDDDQAHLEGALRFLERAATGGDRPTVLLSDGFLDPTRMAVAGRVEENPQAWLDDALWRRLSDGVNAAAETCREHDFQAAFHYHTGSYVETPREIERLIEGIDPSLVGLCLDTGHSFFGGGDPVQLLEDHGDLVTHVHLKDVNLAVLEELRAQRLGLEELWNRQGFCELGTGDVDLDACLELLESRGYSGWVIVEHDRLLQPGDTREVLRASACRSRQYLRARGL